MAGRDGEWSAVGARGWGEEGMVSLHLWSCQRSKSHSFLGLSHFRRVSDLWGQGHL